ncbi:hypothetical protein H8E07_04350, partial [bacterium]|nr:hypothetical protein [bacterium]
MANSMIDAAIRLPIRTLTMLAALTLLAASTPLNAAPRVGVPEVTVMSASDAATVLVFTFPLTGATADDRLTSEELRWARPRPTTPGPDGEPLSAPHRHQAVVAVPTRAAVGWEVAGHAWLVAPRSPAAPAIAVEVTPPQIFRDVPLATMIVSPEVADGVLGSLTVVLHHPPQARYGNALAATLDKAVPQAPLAGAVANQDLFSRLTAGLADLRRQEKSDDRQEDHAFLQTDNWLELEIEQSGAYVVEGEDFSFAGIANPQVDPDKLRCYRAWPVALPDDPEFVPATWQDDYAGLTEVALDV